MSQTKSTKKNNKKVVLLTAISAVLTAVLVLSGVGLYLRVSHKEKNPIVEVNPLDFSIDTWDGKIEAVNFNENYAGRGVQTKTINSAASFAHFVREVNNGNDYSNHIIYLNSSIDLNGQKLDPIGTDEHPFRGIFDGGYYTIYNAEINGNGLFGTTENATIKNIGLYNANASLINRAINTHVENSFVRLGNGNIANEYISTNGNHHITNVFVDSDAEGIVGKLSTDYSNENRVLIQESYFNLGQNAICELEQDSFVTEEKVIKPNMKSDFDNWNYSSEYDATMDWADYDYLEGSRKLDFNLPLQTGFVKTYLTGSCYESVMIAGETVIDTSNLAEAFKEADKTTEAEVNLLVEKIFMEAEADLINAEVTVNAVEDTTIIRGEHNEGSMFVASGTSKIVLGKEKEAISGMSTNESHDAKIVLDGNKEFVEANKLESGALVVAYGGTVEIHENVELKNNINNNVNNGGAVLLYNTDEQAIVEAEISGCVANENGGGICAIGVAPETIGSINDCEAINGGGGAMAILDELESEETINQMHTLYGKKMTVRPMERVEVTSDTALTAGQAINGNKGTYGGAFFVHSSVYRLTFPSGSNVSPVTFGSNRATGTTTITASATLDSNKTLNGLGGAILFYNQSSISSLTIQNAKFNSNYALNGSGGALCFAVDTTNQTAQKININAKTYFSDGYAKYGGGIASLRITSSHASAHISINTNSVTNTEEGFYNTGTYNGTTVYTEKGGAIYTSGDLTLNSTVFDTCKAKTHGGAIFVAPGLTTSRISGGVFKNCNAGDSGGAIQISNTTYMTGSTFTSNSATKYGGAVQPSAYSEFRNCSFDKNTSGYSGGAIYNNQNMWVENCSFDSNEAGSESNGGAIGGGWTVTLAGTTSFVSNSAKCGGAIYCNGLLKTSTATDTMFKGRFYHNTATANGGAIYAHTVTLERGSGDDEAFYGNKAASGGAIEDYSGENTMTLTNMSFVNNTATGDGGAVRAAGNVDITSCVFTDNSSKAGAGAIKAIGNMSLYGTCTFTRNYCVSYGGALDCDATLTIASGCTATFTRNQAGKSYKDGGAIYCGVQKIIVDGTINLVNNFTSDASGYSEIWATYGIDFGTTGALTWTASTNAAQIKLGATGYINNATTSVVQVLNVYKDGVSAYDGTNYNGIIYTTASALTATASSKAVKLMNMPSWGHIDYNKILTKTAVVTPLTWYSTSPSISYGSRTDVSLRIKSSVAGTLTWVSTDPSVIDVHSSNTSITLTADSYVYLYCNVLKPSSKATITVTFVPTDTSSFSKAVSIVDLSTTKASTSVTVSENLKDVILESSSTQAYTFKYQASNAGTVSINPLTPSVATIVSYTSSVTANTAYTCNVTLKSVGSVTFSIIFTPTDSTKYDTSAASFTLRVGAKINYDYAGGTGAGTGTENVSGATYGFAQQSDGYFKPGNVGYSSTYALTKFTFTATSTSTIFDVTHYVSSSYYNSTYAIFSNLNETLSSSISEDSTYFASYKGVNSSNAQTLTYSTTPGETYFIYVKYICNVSSNSYYVKFKINSGAVINQSHYFVDSPAFTLNNPTREGYSFLGWTGSNGTTPSTSVTVAKGTSSGVLNYTANWQANIYSIKWDNEDGTNLQTTVYNHGEIPTYTGATPTKASDAQYNYTFAGWTPTIVPVTESVTYTATYTKTLRTYTITWLDDNGSTLETDINVPYGVYPSYDGANPSKETTAQYIYTFNGWTPSVNTVSGDATYTATYTSTTRTYIVTWKHEDGTIIKTDTIEYGQTPVYNGETPSKENTSAETYSFTGWTPTISTVTGDVSYTATFSTSVTAFTITWINDDGTVLETDYNVAYGATPVYNGSTPTKAPDVQYNYIFKCWAPEITPVTGAKTYMAQFTATPKNYIVFINPNNSNYGSVSSSNGQQMFSVAYGQEVVVEDNKMTVAGVTITATPKASTAQYKYSFQGWNFTSGSVVGDMTVVANFVQEVQKYTVKIVTNNAHGTLTSNAETFEVEVEYGTQIYVTDTNVLTIGEYHFVAIPNESTASNTYSFTSWTDATGTITANRTITANFTVATKTYSVSVVSSDSSMGTILGSSPINANYGASISIAGNTIKVGNTTYTAQAKSGYQFVAWEGVAGTVDGNMTIKAIFVAVE